MKFKDKFKSGDIICSDRFHNGLCMVVEEVSQSKMWRDEPDFRYSCQDLVRDGQGWLAYERDSIWNKPYDWRIATDDDIANYLSRFLDIPLGLVGEWYVAKLTDSGIVLEDLMFTDRNVYLEADELADLKRIIDGRLG